MVRPSKRKLAGRKFGFQKKSKDIEILEVVDNSEFIHDGVVEVGSDGAELVGVALTKKLLN